SLLSKKEEIDKTIYVLGHVVQIEQYVFNSNTLKREFFEDIPNPIIKLSNTQQFSLKSNTNIGIYGRTGTGKTIALQWYLFNALAKGCGTNDNTYLGIVDGKAADLFALGKLLQEDLGEQIAVGSSPQMLAKLSREFVEIMNERFEIIKQNSSLNADAYDLGMTPNFLFVDELAS
ncbi:cell division protein FtsK, partial [Streptococcus pneumoniae]|nr:cell division protein FtsK [Streptococcus pneumoniae]